VKVKKSALLTKLRKDPDALRKLFDFVQRDSSRVGEKAEIPVGDKVYTVKRSPNISISGP
jgi:hypothetical protein